MNQKDYAHALIQIQDRFEQINDEYSFIELDYGTKEIMLKYKGKSPAICGINISGSFIFPDKNQPKIFNEYLIRQIKQYKELYKGEKGSNIKEAEDYIKLVDDIIIQIKKERGEEK